MKIRALLLGLAFALFSLLSLAAVLLAWQANRTADESLQRIMETNDAAKPTPLDIWAVAPTQMVSVDTCFDAKTKLYVLRYQTQNSMVFTNLGSKAVALVGAGFSDSQHQYAVKRDADLAAPIAPLGSVEMFPGSSQEIFFGAAYRSDQDGSYTTREQSQQAASNLKPVQRAFWQFHFSDGSVYRVELKSLWFAAGQAAKNTEMTDCETL